MNIQDWFPLALQDWFDLHAVKILSRIFSNTTIQKHQFFSLSLIYGPTFKSVHDYWKNHSFDYMDLCQQSDVSAFNTLSRFVIAFLPRSKHLLISWLQPQSTVILGPKKRKSVTTSTFPPSVCHEVMGLDAHHFFWMLSFKPAFSLSSFTLIKRVFTSSSLSVIRVYHLYIWGCWYFSWQSLF